MELMTAMNGINDKIERHNHPAESEEDGEAALAAQRGKTGIKEVDVLWKRLESLDSGEKRLQREIEAIEREMNHLTTKYKKSTVSRCLLSQRCVVHSS
jgi:predicted phage-related endonuclease